LRLQPLRYAFFRRADFFITIFSPDIKTRLVAASILPKAGV
jgi:hypothetical protein